MAKFNQYYPSLIGGLQSPKVNRRIDLPQQRAGCKELTNFIVTPQGSITKRPGFIWICNRKLSTATRYIGFESSTGETYNIELGNLYARFYTNKAPVLYDAARITNPTFGANITGWTNGSTGSASISWDGTNFRMLLNGAASSIARASQQITSLQSGYTRYKLTLDVFTNSVTVKIGASAGSSSIYSKVLSTGTGKYITFDSNASSFYITFDNPNNNTAAVDNIVLTEQYTLTTPYSAAQVDRLQFDGRENTLILTHPSLQMRKLTYTSATSWAITAITLVDGPYFSMEDTSYGHDVTTGNAGIWTFSLATVGTGRTLTSTVANFVSTDVGRLFRFRTVNTAAWGYGTITGYTNSTTVTVTITKALDGTTGANQQWRLGCFSDTTGWPGSVTIFEDRIVYGYTNTQPQGLWPSRSGSETIFSPDADYADLLTAATALTLPINRGIVNWLAGNQRLYAGNSKDVDIISGGQSGLTADAGGAKARSTSSSSVAALMPTLTQSSIIYISQSHKKLLALDYYYESDSARAIDISLNVDSFLSGGIKQIAFHEEPYNVVWCLMNNGELMGCTYLKDEKIVSWHKHIIGGTNATVEAINTIRGANQHELWIGSKRTINGSTVYSVEVMNDDFMGKTKEEAFFVDAGYTITGTNISSVSDLNYLEGTEVVILKDGAVHSSKTVTSGTITLDYTGDVVTLGIPYTALFTTNASEGGNRIGFAQTKPQRVGSIGLSLVDTLNISLRYESNTNNNQIVLFNANQIFGQGPELFTGTKRQNFNSGWTNEATITVISDTPTPATIAGIALSIIVSEDS